MMHYHKCIYEDLVPVAAKQNCAPEQKNAFKTAEPGKVMQRPLHCRCETMGNTKQLLYRQRLQVSSSLPKGTDCLKICSRPLISLTLDDIYNKKSINQN